MVFNRENSWDIVFLGHSRAGQGQVCHMKQSFQRSKKRLLVLQNCLASFPLRPELGHFVHCLPPPPIFFRSGKK